VNREKEIGLKEGLGFGVEDSKNLVIYNCPVPLYFRFIDYAKQHAGNKGWVAIEKLLDYANIAQRLDSIEERLAKLDAVLLDKGQVNTEDDNGKI
jgi:hypothetical protein